MNAEHLDMQTPNGAQLNIDALYKICPSCFTESKGEDGTLHHVVDFEKLRSLLGDMAVDDAPESYDFTWVGKREAQREANARINKTLRPCVEESVDWDKTQNLYIEGDNLEVLKLLQENYLGKVKMIYIDPPYNTGNDFVYNDDFKEDTESFQIKLSERIENPFYILKTEKGFGGPNRHHEAHQIPIKNPRTDKDELLALEDWMRSYNVGEILNNLEGIKL